MLRGRLRPLHGKAPFSHCFLTSEYLPQRSCYGSFHLFHHAALNVRSLGCLVQVPSILSTSEVSVCWLAGSEPTWWTSGIVVIIYLPGLKHDLPSILSVTARAPKRCHVVDASPYSADTIRCFTPSKQTVFSDRSEPGLLVQWFSNFSLHQNGAEGVVKQATGSTPRGTEQGWVGPSTLHLCLPGDSTAAGLWHTSGAYHVQQALPWLQDIKD